MDHSNCMQQNGCVTHSGFPDGVNVWRNGGVVALRLQCGEQHIDLSGCEPYNVEGCEGGCHVSENPEEEYRL